MGIVHVLYFFVVVFGEFFSLLSSGITANFLHSTKTISERNPVVGL